MSENNLNEIKKRRIWELDALRGLFIICVIFIHLMFDLDYFLGVISISSFPAPYLFIQEYGGILFILLSGICVTLGSKCIKRGLIVLGSACIITAVTLIMGDSCNYIFFGILHLLAFCMLTYPIYKKLPAWIILALSITLIAIGIYFNSIYIESGNWFWLGLINRSFAAGDYFPILPNLGYFMLGVFLGRTVYKNKTSLLPRFPHKNAPVRFLSWCGRNSLFIYLGHQPVIYGLCLLIKYLTA